MDVRSWAQENVVGDEMRWCDAARQQIDAFHQLAKQLGGTNRVVSTHTSKSILLPVVEITLPNGRLILRDNFHDICMSIVWDFVPDLDLSEVCEPKDWAWYLAEMEKCRGYTYRNWTDEEVNDPRILRVSVEARTRKYWSKVSGKEKDRWARRMTDASWFWHDWSSGNLIFVPNMGPGCKIYRLSHGQAEGMDDYPQTQWEPGMKEGMFCLSRMENVAALANTIARALND